MSNTNPVVPSPCSGICYLDPEHQHCVGCWRHQDEIASWSILNNQEKIMIRKQLEQRERKYTAK